MERDFSKPSAAAPHPTSLPRFARQAQTETSPRGLESGPVTLNKTAATGDEAPDHGLVGGFSLLGIIGLEAGGGYLSGQAAKGHRGRDAINHLKSRMDDGLG